MNWLYGLLLATVVSPWKWLAMVCALVALGIMTTVMVREMRK